MGLRAVAEHLAHILQCQRPTLHASHEQRLQSPDHPWHLGKGANDLGQVLLAQVADHVAHCQSMLQGFSVAVAMSSQGSGR